MRALLCKGFCEQQEMECKTVMKEWGLEVVELSLDSPNKGNDISGWLKDNACDFVMTISFWEEIAARCNEANVSYISVVTSLPQAGFYTEAAAYESNIIFINDYMMAQKLQMWCQGAVIFLPSGYLENSMTGTPACLDNSPLFMERSDYAQKLTTGVSDWTRGYVEQLIRNQAIVGGSNVLPDVLNNDVVKQLQKNWDREQDSENVIESYTVKSEYCASVYLAGEVERYQENMLHDYCKNKGVSLYKWNDRIYQITEKEKCRISDGIFIVLANKAGYTGIDRGLYDVLYKGGFVLTEFRAEVTDYFEIGSHLDVWTSTEELWEKIKYYLKEKEKRNEIAANGKKQVEEMSFAYSIENMLNMILGE